MSAIRPIGLIGPILPPLAPDRTADEVARAHRLEINTRVLAQWKGYVHGAPDLNELARFRTAVGPQGNAKS